LLSGSPPLTPDPIDQNFIPKQLRSPFQLLPKTLCYSDRRAILRLDEADECGREDRNSMKAHKYKLKPSAKIIAVFESWLAPPCELYNAALQERRDVYRINHLSIDYLAQANHLPEIKAEWSGGSLMGLMEMVVAQFSRPTGFQFWDNKIDALKQLREQLRRGGIIALVHQPRNLGATEDDTTEAGERLARDLEAAEFKDIKVERKMMKPVSTVCVLGRTF